MIHPRSRQNLTPGRSPSRRVSLRPSVSVPPEQLARVVASLKTGKTAPGQARVAGEMLVEAATLREVVALAGDARTAGLLLALREGRTEDALLILRG